MHQKKTIPLFLNVCCVLCSVGLLLYGSFCHGALSWPYLHFKTFIIVQLFKTHYIWPVYDAFDQVKIVSDFHNCKTKCSNGNVKNAWGNTH